VPYNPSLPRQSTTGAGESHLQIEILEQFTGRPIDWGIWQIETYLQKLEIAPHTRPAALIARKVWQQVQRATRCYPVVSVGADNQVLFAWDYKEHHAEIEVFPDGHTEAFYLNMQTGETWDRDVDPGNILLSEFREYLQRC
jgi:hypothetical protein